MQSRSVARERAPPLSWSSSADGSPHSVVLAGWALVRGVDIKQTITTDRAKWRERVGFYLYVEGLRK